jgi:hypothetical protein
MRASSEPVPYTSRGTLSDTILAFSIENNDESDVYGLPNVVSSTGLIDSVVGQHPEPEPRPDVPVSKAPMPLGARASRPSPTGAPAHEPGAQAIADTGDGRDARSQGPVAES